MSCHSRAGGNPSTVQTQRPGRTPTGFTIIEVMMAMVILAVLMAAVGLAFDASVKNYQANEGIYKTMNTGRQSLLRITNDLRTAQDIPLSTEEPNTQVSVGNDFDGDGNYEEDFTYRFDNSTSPGTLYYDDNITGNSYVLCENVTAMTFNRAIAPGSSPTAIRSVRILMTLTDDLGKVTQTLAAGSVVRKNL